MRIAVAGAGAVGIYIANDLVDAGHDVLLIEQSLTVQNKSKTDPGVTWFIGDACEVSSLRKAELDTYDVLVAATGDDEDNLVVSLLAKTEFAIPQIIARVNHPKNEWMFNEAWGVDQAVSTPHLLTALIEEAVSVGRLIEIFKFEGGRVRLVECTLAEDSPAVNKTVSELKAPADITLVAIVRGDHVQHPKAGSVLEVDDEILALVTDQSYEDLRRLLTGKSD